jgi:murein DD-endopeptidase MepM/ murein hydrolase activator NlpD
MERTCGRLVLIRLLAGLGGIVLLAGCPTTNHAAAVGWRGFVDTDLQFAEFYGSDHTIAARLMIQYPNAYTAPILAVNGTGRYMIAKADVNLGSGVPARLTVDVGGTVVTFNAPVLPGSQWQHVALVRQSGNITVYLNGTRLCAPAPLPCAFAPGATPPNGTLRIGRLANGGTVAGAETQFYGFIDDVAVFRRALSAAEVAALAAGPRLTGSESGLHAGYTFDDRTPTGGLLPAALRRPVTFGTLTPGPVMPSAPAFRSIISEMRDSAFDSRLLPPPIQQIAMILPFPPGEIWEVGQGWEGAISHNGRAAFAWDFNIPAPGVTQGKPIFAAAGGAVAELMNDRDCCGCGGPANNVAVRHAPDELGVYLHFTKGSVAVMLNQMIAAGTKLATAGDSGNTACGSYHLHFALHNLPESQAGVLVTIPGAFSDYEVSTDRGATWERIARGVPKQGEWVRRPGASAAGEEGGGITPL